MLRLIGYLVVNVLILFGLSALLPNFEVVGIGSAVLFIVVLTVLNWTVGPLIKFFAWPFNFITFGLINSLINLVVVSIAVGFVRGIIIEDRGFRYWLIVLVISVSFVLGQGLVNRLTEDKYEKRAES